jgi:hypothetical protein
MIFPGYPGPRTAEYALNREIESDEAKFKAFHELIARERTVAEGHKGPISAPVLLGLV